MGEEYIIFLKSLWVGINTPTLCGDGCCQIDNFESVLVEEGDEFFWSLVDLTNLQECIDYKYCL